MNANSLTTVMAIAISRSAATRFVAQVGVVAVGRADECALSGIDLHLKRVLETSPVVVNA
jgi:hypothetical protein